MTDERGVQRGRWISVLAWGAGALGLTGAAGWILDSHLLRVGGFGESTMKPNTALAVVTLAVGVWAMKLKRVWLVRAAAVVAIFVGLGTLAGWIFQWPVGIDQLWWHQDGVLLRMATGTASCLALLGGSLLASSFPHARRSTQFFAASALAISMSGLTSYTYGLTSLTVVPFLTTMAMHTSLALTVLAVSILGLTSDGPLTRPFLGEGSASLLGRQLLAAAIAFPWLVGLVVLRLELSSTMGPASALALMATVTMAALALVVAQFTSAVSRRERDLGITLDSIGDGVLVTDAEGRVQRLNAVAEELTGWKLDDARGRPVDEVFHIINEDTRKPVENPVTHVIRDGKIVGLANHTLLVDRQGRERPIADSGAPVRREDGRLQGVVLVFRDMTAEAEARHRIEQDARNLRTVIEQTPFGVLASRDGKGVFANPEATRIFGLQAAEDIAGRTLSELLPPEEAEVTRRRTEAQASGQRLGTRRFTTRAGVLVDSTPLAQEIEFNGLPTRLTLLQTVSDSEGMARQLARQAAFNLASADLSRAMAHAGLDVQRVLNTLVELVARQDDDAVMVRLPGHATNQLSHGIALHSTSPRLLELAKRLSIPVTAGPLVTRTMESQQAVVVPSERIREQAPPQLVQLLGEALPNQVTAVALRAQQRPLGVLLIARYSDRPFEADELIFLQDMADRAAQAVMNAQLYEQVKVALDESARSAEQLRATEAQLRQSQKLQAVGMLAGGIAHDFNNLLTVILSLTGIRIDETEPGPLKDDLLEIKSAGDRASDLTRQLLAFSRKQVMQLRSLDVNKLITELDGMLRRLLGEDMTLALELGPGLDLVRADPTLLTQVMMNLAVNARDAMPSGGTLTVRTRLRELAEPGPDGLAAGRYVCLEVRDTGVGIPPEAKERLFEPFFTTKALGKGTGLGLSTSYGIAKQTGGTLTAESEVGKGSTFTLWLPITAQPRTATPQPPPREGVQHAKVLVVEDENSVREVARRLLEHAGYTVHVASSAEEAMNLLPTLGRIDLLLTDVVMPGKSGRELADVVAATQPHIKVLFMSGYTEDAIVKRGVLEGQMALLQKPFTRETLLQSVRLALDPLQPLLAAQRS